MPPFRAPPPIDSETLHATAVAVDNRAALILGRAGSGKSGLALQLMALGAGLISDDRTILTRKGTQLYASAPETIRGRIEARGTGILATPPARPSPVRLIVDLDQDEDARLPDWHEVELLGVRLPCLRKSPYLHFPAAVLLYLKGERLA